MRRIGAITRWRWWRRRERQTHWRQASRQWFGWIWQRRSRGPAVAGEEQEEALGQRQPLLRLRILPALPPYQRREERSEEGDGRRFRRGRDHRVDVDGILRDINGQSVVGCARTLDRFHVQDILKGVSDGRRIYVKTAGDFSAGGDAAGRAT